MKRLYFLTTPHIINIKKNHCLIFSLYIFIYNNTNHLLRVHLSDKVYVVIFLVYLLLFCRWCCHNNIPLRNTYQSRSNFPLLWSISWYKLQNIKLVLILFQLGKLIYGSIKPHSECNRQFFYNAISFSHPEFHILSCSCSITKI